MTNSKILSVLTAAGLSLALSAPVFAMGDYLRKEKDTINVFVKDGKLYCNRAEDKFEMCHGMVQEGDEWKGKKMKHPDMPGFMTFNGTVTISETSLTIKGCAVGNSMCDTEVWTKMAVPVEDEQSGEEDESAPKVSQ